MQADQIQCHHGRSAGLVFFGLLIMVGSSLPSRASYVNRLLPAGHAMMVTPLIQLDYRVSAVVTAAPEGTKLRVFDGETWLVNEFKNGVWSMPDMALPMGQGVIVESPAPWIQTWVGSLSEGELSVLIRPGMSTVGSLVPQTGGISSVLELPRTDGLQALYPNALTGQLEVLATCQNGDWVPAEPTIVVGEGFVVNSPRRLIWQRFFNVFPYPEVNPWPELIRTQPAGGAYHAGEPFSLSVEMVHAGSYRYQWQRNGHDIAGATNAIHAIPSANASSPGDYWVRILSGNVVINSDLATVVVRPPRGLLSIWRSPGNGGMVLEPVVAGSSPFVIEVSTNLVHWTELSGAIDYVGSSVIDPDPSAFPARYYRLRFD